VSYSEIDYVVSENIALITLNRPAKKNALSPTMNNEILDAVTRIEADPSIRGVLFTGAGDSFCAGLDLDLSFLKTMEAGTPEPFQQVMDPILGWYRKLYDLPKPTVAAVNGHCYGGGLVPVSLCDVAIASDNAVFGLSEINFSHFPAGGSTWAASHFLLPKHALYLCLSGDPISADDAFRMGLVSVVVEHASLADEAWRLVTRLAEKNPHAYKTAKTMCRMTPRMQLWEAIELEMAHIHENYFFTEGEMVKRALQLFAGKNLRPGTGDTYRDETKGDM
jgi:trans-feruloyl-CoA hydratase/vanillin synthase